MINNIQKNIIKNIILAQVASDGGKHIEDLLPEIPPFFRKEGRKTYQYGYFVKDGYIENAINIINTTCRCGINYFCVKTEDQNGYDSILVYFDIKLDDKRYQISFHSPLNKSSLVKYTNDGRPTRWVKNKDGGSRNCCLNLINKIWK